MSRLARCACLALSLVLSLYSVAPHQDHGLAESASRAHLEQVGNCSNPVTQHFHAATAKPAHPCVGCTRQHSGSTFSFVAVGAMQPVVVATIVAPAVRAAQAFVRIPHLRGPPA